MPFDTSAKRYSMIRFGRTWVPIEPVPAGMIGAPDRRVHLARYALLTFAVPVISEPIVGRVLEGRIDREAAVSVGVFDEVMFRERPHSIRLQLLLEMDDSIVTPALATYSHRLIAKASHDDADAEAIFDLTGVFTDEDDVLKIVEGLIPASATDNAAIPAGATSRLYLQWQTTDGDGEPWIVAAGRLTVRSSLPLTP